MMTTTSLTITAVLKPRNQQQRPKRDQGIVLIVAMILLIVISLLVVNSVRISGSSEGVSGNVRTTELATQAADIALRHCEASVLRVVLNSTGDFTSTGATYSTTFTTTNILPASASPTWQNLTTWDTSTTATYALSLPQVNRAGATTYHRPPECMVEPLVTWISGEVAPSSTASFVVTARGFGPEVPAAPSGGRPAGTEVWLQSHIELQ
jgi:type IV pilus assembly protein PilX